MDAFVTTMILVALAETGGRSQLLGAVLAMRFGTVRAIVIAAAMVVAVNCTISAFAGSLIAGMISVDAIRLFYAAALGFGGLGMLFWRPPVESLERWPTGAFVTSLAGLFIVQFGDGGQFIILATAARTDAPVWAAAGGIIGALAAIIPAILLQERLAQIVPVRWIRLIGGSLLVVVGLFLALRAFGLIG